MNPSKKKKFIKPKIKVKELNLKSLLGENGWYSPPQKNNLLARWSSR